MEELDVSKPVPRTVWWAALGLVSIGALGLVLNAVNDVNKILFETQLDQYGQQAALLKGKNNQPVQGKVEETKQIIVKFLERDLPPGLSVAAERANLERAQGLKKLYSIESINADVYQISEDDTAEEVVRRIMKQEKNGIEYVEVDAVTTMGVEINDPTYTDGSLWGMYGDTTTPINAFGSQAGEVWAAGVVGSAKVVAGIVDTGVNYTHPDLYLNIWLNQGEIPSAIRSNVVDVDGDGYIGFRDLNQSSNAGQVTDKNGNSYIDAGDLLNDSRWENGVDDDKSGLIDDLVGWDYFNGDNDPVDDNGHGTHVAGTVGAMGGNAVGVAGVSWHTLLMPLKFSGADGSGFVSRAASSFDYFTNLSKSSANAGKRFAVTNNSWGTNTYSATLQGATDRAGAANIITVASAGNSGRDTDTTAYYPQGISTVGSLGYETVLSVGSINNGGGKSWFSNFGNKTVDILAPGEGILSTTANGSYGGMSGTSMAAPHVGGAVALLAAASPSPSARDIHARMLSSATPVAAAANVTVSGGYLDVQRLIGGGAPLPPPDTTAPTAPQSLRSTSVSTTAVVLAWNAATDNIGVKEYRLFRNGVQVAVVTGTSYSDNGLAAATVYTYTVRAVDAAGNVSGDSNQLAVTTSAAADTTAPTAPQSLRSTSVSTTAVALAWNAATDDMGVKEYRVLRNGVQVAVVSGTSYSDEGLTAATAYTYTVRAIDAAGNVSGDSNQLAVTTSTAADTTAPTAPQTLRTTSVGTTNIGLAWNAATDNVGVVGYRLFRNGTQITTVSGTTYTDSDLVAQTIYTYTVRAIDAAGNVSGDSNQLAVTTVGDLQIVSHSVSTKTNNAATISATLSAPASVVVSYGTDKTNLTASAKSETTSAAHTINLSGLAAGATYYYQVTATNSAGSVVTSTVSSFKTSQGGPPAGKGNNR